MLSDEEKYAIDYLKIYIERDVMYENRHYKQIEIILNLIEKQSKEIEELKEVKWYYEISRVPKDKIKAKIEEVDYKMIAHQDVREAVKQVLQSLLEKE